MDQRSRHREKGMTGEGGRAVGGVSNRYRSDIAPLIWWWRREELW